MYKNLQLLRTTSAFCVGDLSWWCQWYWFVKKIELEWLLKANFHHILCPTNFHNVSSGSVDKAVQPMAPVNPGPSGRNIPSEKTALHQTSSSNTNPSNKSTGTGTLEKQSTIRPSSTGTLEKQSTIRPSSKEGGSFRATLWIKMYLFQIVFKKSIKKC